MGQLTFDTIVSEGLLEAGVDGLTARAGVHLKKWLRSQAGAFLWPQLFREKAAVALALDAQKITFGQGSGGESLAVLRINDPLKLYNADFSARANIRVQTLWSDDLSTDDVINKPANNKGTPAYCRVRPDAQFGKWDLIFDKVADKAYLLEMSYYVVPADPAGSAAPWYPNDDTMIKSVEVFALKYDKQEEYATEREVLRSMTVNDRLKYGQVAGTNENAGLNTDVFR